MIAFGNTQVPPSLATASTLVIAGYCSGASSAVVMPTLRSLMSDLEVGPIVILDPEADFDILANTIRNESDGRRVCVALSKCDLDELHQLFLKNCVIFVGSGYREFDEVAQEVKTALYEYVEDAPGKIRGAIIDLDADRNIRHEDCAALQHSRQHKLVYVGITHSLATLTSKKCFAAWPDPLYFFGNVVFLPSRDAQAQAAAERLVGPTARLSNLICQDFTSATRGPWFTEAYVAVAGQGAAFELLPHHYVDVNRNRFRTAAPSRLTRYLRERERAAA